MPDGCKQRGTDHLCLGASLGQPQKRRRSLQPIALLFLVPPAIELLLKKSMTYVMAGLFRGKSKAHVLARDGF